MTEAQLQDLPHYQDSPAFTPVERLVLDLAVHLTAQAPVPVPDALLAQLRAHFDDAQLVELVAAIAWENYRSRFNRAFGVRAVGYSHGAFCALPERPARAVDSLPTPRA